MSKKVIIIKITVFLLLFCLLFMGLTQVLKRKELSPPWDMSNKIIGFKNEKPNSMDVMYFGSSHAYCTFNPTVIDKKANISSFSYATQQQPLWISYYYMKEALKTQSPKTFVLEIFGAKYEDEYAQEAPNRSAIEPLPFSKNLVDLISASVKKEERYMYYLPLIKYHTRWDKLTAQDFNISYYNSIDPLRGYVRLDKTKDSVKPDISNVTEMTPLLSKTQEYLNKIIELTNKNGIELILVGAPCNATAELKRVFNSVEQIAIDNNVLFIDYNMIYDEVGIDPKKHFYDGGHLNFEGATLVSNDFANYL